MFGKKNKPLEFETVTTKGGDKGESGYYSGERMRKDDTIFEAVGELDSLNSYLGVVRAELNQQLKGGAAKFINRVQTRLIGLSGLIATNPHTKEGRELYESLVPVTEDDIAQLEYYQKQLLENTAIDSAFVNPGGCSLSAAIDVARSQTRAAERRIVSVIRDKVRTDLYEVQRYVNRLSDVLFVMARYFEQGKVDKNKK